MAGGITLLRALTNEWGIANTKDFSGGVRQSSVLGTAVLDLFINNSDIYLKCILFKFLKRIILQEELLLYHILGRKCALNQIGLGSVSSFPVYSFCALCQST